MTTIDLTPFVAARLTADERAILQAFTDGATIRAIADTHALHYTEVRNLLWDRCRLQERIARHVLASDRSAHPRPDQPADQPNNPADDDQPPPPLRAYIDEELAAAGHTRTWTPDERLVAMRMARLVRAGITNLDLAEAIARGQDAIGAWHPHRHRRRGGHHR